MRVYRFEEIDSTNIFLKNKKDLKEYDTAIAKVQNAGRGRRGNVWISQEGAALFSFAVKHEKEIPMEEYLKLPLVTGFALMKVLEEEESAGFMFKWTNDIYLNDKKISGILIEKIDDFFIIGIGINMNNCEFGDLNSRASSIYKETGKYLEIEETIFKVIENFEKSFQKFKNGGWKEMLSEINSKNYLFGKNVNIHIGENISQGICREINEDGTLKVEVENEVKNFSVGEVHIRW